MAALFKQGFTLQKNFYAKNAQKISMLQKLNFNFKILFGKTSSQQNSVAQNFKDKTVEILRFLTV